MATIQQLEKLHHIQRLFYVEDSLEAAVAGERVGQIITRTEKLIRQRAFLRDERRRLRIATNAVEERQRSLKHMLRSDWIPKSLIEPCAPEENRRIRLNVGGLMFETPVHVLMKDPQSLLAQLCGPEPPIAPDSADDCFYFDRDWWLFRYVLQFLRDGVLPEDRSLLAQLYRESSFWQLAQMQRAIEEEKLHLRSVVPSTLPGEWKVEATVAAATGIDDTTGKLTDVTPHDAASYKELKHNETVVWWKKLPSWWQAVDEQQQRAVVTKVEQAASKKQDWWTDTVYKGRVYLPPSEAELQKRETEQIAGQRGWWRDAEATAARSRAQEKVRMQKDPPLIPPHNITRGTWAAFGSDNNREDTFRYSNIGSGGGGYGGGDGYGSGFGGNSGAAAGAGRRYSDHPDHPPLQPFLANAANKSMGGAGYGGGF